MGRKWGRTIGRVTELPFFGEEFGQLRFVKPYPILTMIAFCKVAMVK